MNKHLLAFVLIPLILLCSTLTGTAQMETYSDSLVNAKTNADAPINWMAAYDDIVKISTAASVGANPFDLKYYGDQLIVRTASTERAYNGYYWPNIPTTAGSSYAVRDGTTIMRSWVTTGKEVTSFIDRQNLNANTIIRGLEKGTGMSSTGTHDAIFEMAVTIGDHYNPHLLRPTRNPDPAKYSTNPGEYGTYGKFAPGDTPFPASPEEAGIGRNGDPAAEAVYANYKAAYNAWATQSHSDPDVNNRFPWTELGYTYHWGQAPNVPTKLSEVQGLSEFILLGGTRNSDPAKTPSGTNEEGKVVVVGIYSTQSYLYTKNDGTKLRNAAGAQYGNGFASFNVTGPCNTLWAGAAYQVGARRDTGLPHTITIGPDGLISSAQNPGQGILVSSRDYTVTNAGSITATADTKKFNIAGTENIALLFKGDAAPYSPQNREVKNTLINSGTIVAPGANGTAVAAWAGDTEIINSGTITGTGTGYAIRTGAGNDTLTINDGQIDGSIDLGTGTNRFNFTLNKDMATSALIVNANTVTLEGNTLAVNVTRTGNNIRNNDSFLIVDAVQPILYNAKLSILNDSALPMITFSDWRTADNLNLYFIAARDNTFYTLRSGNASLGFVLDSMANTATGDMAAVLEDLDFSGNPRNARQMEPNVNNGLVQTSFGTVGQYNNTILNRIGQVQACQTEDINMTGARTCHETANNSAWVQGFGSYLHQGTTGVSDGYTANIWGLSLGFDRFLYKNILAGFSFGSARNYVTTHDVNTNTDADSYQGSIYGSLAQDAYYLDAILSFSYNRYDTSRHIVFSGINRTAKSNYDGCQVSGYLEGGYAFNIRGIILTPLMSLQMIHLSLEDYTETQAGALNLKVDRQNYNLFQTGLGMKVAYPIINKNVRITPELHAKWLYDFAGDAQQITSSFAGGGTSFVTQGVDPARSSGSIGAKLTIMTPTSWSVSLNYDFETKPDFYGHHGWISLRYEF
ncbi:MAG: Outer membrane protein B precursor [Deltaproteobacteria bacterium ADurb.Bin151]|nr:MAG: Outer membrane protein B precursor [Deltaproteobacteria bacterium ADurb.Bin151]HNZ11886.1 autotransporter domain-containing protein [Smithellaceae bacterium]HOG80756.1 autotransporter domain-containing protein [Smithellaceae bacterium]